ncbi:MAG TPA: hypothetical protein PLE19_11095 [Planctomycetota bacterium]|nr:hypothetical protein [Planctomycetota bacterium]HRR78967.1 hypothetical protein [Planctomycetota bacterium]HRT92989.1 hypothetical protein [Planctomycetota bacterium]
MTLREAILIGCLAALGVVSFREQSAANQAHLAALLCRERRETAALAALRERGRALRREAEALTADRYYIARLARADLGWRPAPASDPGLPPLDVPAMPPSALVQSLPSVPPTLPAVAPPPAPRPPAPPAASPAPSGPARPAPDRSGAQRTLAALGYSSVEHFQAKMMGTRSDGVLDETTVTRAQQLSELLRRLGYDSVKTFQQRNRLPADGVMGRRTEQRALELLRRNTPARSRSYVAVNGR